MTTAEPIGHVRLHDWHIDVTRRYTEFGGLALWMTACRTGTDGRPRSAPQPFGLVRIETDRGRSVTLAASAADLVVVPHSELADAIAFAVLQIHLAGPYTASELDPTTINPATLRANLDAATQRILDLHGARTP